MKQIIPSNNLRLFEAPGMTKRSKKWKQFFTLVLNCTQHFGILKVYTTCCPYLHFANNCVRICTFNYELSFTKRHEIILA